MVNVFKASPLTSAIIATLAAAGLIVGDGTKPTGGGWAGDPRTSVFAGYVVVHPLGGGSIDGSIDDPDDDVSPLYQLSSFGESRAQCELVADLARAALLEGGTFVVGDRKVTRLAFDTVGGAIRFDEPGPPIWQQADRFQAFTTPAS